MAARRSGLAGFDAARHAPSHPSDPAIESPGSAYGARRHRQAGASGRRPVGAEGTDRSPSRGGSHESHRPGDPPPYSTGGRGIHDTRLPDFTSIDRNSDRAGGRAHPEGLGVVEREGVQVGPLARGTWARSSVSAATDSAQAKPVHLA